MAGRSRNCSRYFLKLADSFIRAALWYRESLCPVRTRGSVSPSRMAQIAFKTKQKQKLGSAQEPKKTPQIDVKVIADTRCYLLRFLQVLVQIQRQSVPPSSSAVRTIN